jgi:diguanylate cyclase (GGDEF)-like protein
MTLDESIERLEKLIAQIRQASLKDDKTTLGSALALRQEEGLINEGTSEFRIVVFGDLNEFKQLNDDYSHEAGDVAINSVGELIHRIVIDNLKAKAFRQSGDEFVILLRDDSLQEFLSAVSTLGNIVFSHKGVKLRTAMSLGYAFSDGKTSFGDLIERAEAACQNAKALGDGQCVEWTEEFKQNPLVRKSGKCKKCGGARISWSGPKPIAPTKLRFCPSCGEAL